MDLECLKEEGQKEKLCSGEKERSVRWVVVRKPRGRREKEGDHLGRGDMKKDRVGGIIACAGGNRKLLA